MNTEHNKKGRWTSNHSVFYIHINYICLFTSKCSLLVTEETEREEAETEKLLEKLIVDYQKNAGHDK